MLAKITQFFDQFISSPAAQSDPQHSLNLAVAALLIEMLYSDNHVSKSEENQLHKTLVDHYGIAASEIAELTVLAKDELKEAVDYYQFTSLINSHFDAKQKAKVIEQLWEIASADGKIDSFEEHYLRKIADLLFVPHSVFIQTKLKVLESHS